MGLDAFVACRCWEDGATAPAPAPKDLLGVDEDGFFGLLQPWDGNEDLYVAVEEWMKTACAHRRMVIFRCRVSNWAGYRLFQSALRSAGGPDRFPVLTQELPNGNGGQTSPAAASLMLDELAAFTATPALGERVLLVDEDTGATCLEYIPAYDGVTLLGPGYWAGVDPDGFFVREPDAKPDEAAGDRTVVPGRTLFRSHRFRQRVVRPDVEFSDDVQVVRIAMPPVGDKFPHEEHPTRLRTERVPRRPQDFSGVVDALRDLCRHSVETGNPIVWT